LLDFSQYNCPIVVKLKITGKACKSGSTEADAGRGREIATKMQKVAKYAFYTRLY